MKKLSRIILVIFAFILITIPSYAWSNGGYSTDINNPIYGTHDFLLEKAINMLPSEMKNGIDINVAYYGSETPDCNKNIYCIGDVASHHVYYYSNESVQADNGAVRARGEYDLAKSYLQSNDTYNFSLHLGAMSHYISDVAVFGHTMGAKTDWGAEVHHSAYESYVNNHLNSFDNVAFDGNVENIDAYNATLKLAKETTFDAGIYTNKWMDVNYGWTNSLFTERTQGLINFNANILSDTIYSLMIENIPTDSVSNLTNVSYDSFYINWTWTDPNNSDFDKVQIYINNKYKTSVLKGIQYYKAKKLYANRSYTISTRTVDMDGNISLTWKNHTAWTNTDFEPPMRVRKLKNITYAQNYINWTWKDPKDIDFKKVMVFIDNNFKKNVSKGKRFYNATDFTPNTRHTISTWTVDINGNINKTWTNRSAWTASPNPTPISTPFPTPIEPEILSSIGYNSDLGYYTVVGEIQNNLQSNMNYIKIIATFYDSQNAVIGTDFTYVDIDILKPGQKSPFEISSYPEKISPPRYKLSLDYSTISNEPFSGLEVLSQSSKIDDLGYHKIVGEVKNNGARKASFVKVVVTYYDSSGKVIGKSFSYTNPEDITNGDTAPFEISSYPQKINPAKYEVQVSGD